MNELEAIVQAARAAERAGKESLLATVVGVRGSAYRRPGARMLLTTEGWQAGSISGGCLESDVQRKAWWHTRTSEPTVITYDSTIEEEGDEDLAWGFGLGCNGVVEVLLERIVPDALCCPIGFIQECLKQDRPGVLATIIQVQGQSDGVAIGQRLLLQGASPPISTLENPFLAAKILQDAWHALATSAESVAVTYTLPDKEQCRVGVFLEVVAPPLSLVICGAGHDAVPLARMAKTLGWKVTVIDPRPGILPRPDRFPGADRVLSCSSTDLANQVRLDKNTLAVVMSHNVALDAGMLDVLLRTPVRYIGMLGPRRRTERLLATLEIPDNDRIHSPVGLDIGADTPETIALSILAEMQATVSGRQGGFLRNRTQPIHEPMKRDQKGALISPTVREPVACGLMTSVLA